MDNGRGGEMNALLIPFTYHVELLIHHYWTPENNPQTICYVYVHTLPILNSINIQIQILNNFICSFLW
jgi:hypothetical protein